MTLIDSLVIQKALALVSSEAVSNVTFTSLLMTQRRDSSEKHAVTFLFSSWSSVCVHNCKEKKIVPRLNIHCIILSKY